MRPTKGRLDMMRVLGGGAHTHTRSETSGSTAMTLASQFQYSLYIQKYFILYIIFANVTVQVEL